MILLMLFFIFGSIALGLSYIVLFWAISLLLYLFAYLMSLFGIFVDISGENNIWVIFLVICGISFYVYAVSNFGFALFIFISANFMLFRTADTWRIASA